MAWENDANQLENIFLPLSKLGMEGKLYTDLYLPDLLNIGNCKYTDKKHIYEWDKHSTAYL